VQFPYGAAADVFVPGIIYTFRLTLTEKGTPIYSEIQLLANSPPSSGSFVIVPTTGQALTTEYALSASNWVDDPEDYPLNYQFQYSLEAAQVETFLLRTPMQTSYTTALFSAGLASNNYSVFVSVTVIDTYDAFVRFTAEAGATESSHVAETVRTLLDGISDSVNAYDVDSVLQSVNGVSLYFNVVNCSTFDAEWCGAMYNRDACANTDLTCGACLGSAVGVFGDSNTECFNSSSAPLSYPGDACDSNSICAFGYCSDITSECTGFNKVCPSNTVEAECSGHGTCEYSGVNDGSDCVVTNNFCSASCVCSEGYSGASCQLDPAESESIDADRSILCRALYSTAILQEPSATSLQTLVGPFLKSFTHSEITDIDTFINCSNAFGEIMLLVQAGYLNDLPVEYRTSIATALSNFAVSLNASSLNDMVTSSLDAFVTSLLDSMLEGEEAVELVTDAFQASVTYIISTDLTNATLSPPTTLDGAYYGQTSQPSLTLPVTGLDACGTQSYTKMSLITYSSQGNPYSSSSSSNSSAIVNSTLSNLLEFSVETPVNGSSQVVVVDDDGAEMSSVFRIVQVFENPQEWTSLNQPALMRAVIDPDASATSSSSSSSSSSSTSSLVYETSSCEVVQYTAYNATYECTDMAAMLCSSQLSSRRRRLQAETGTSAGSGVGVSFYTDIAEAVGIGAADVLGSPISNLADSTIGLCFISSMIFATLVGYVYFARWDHIEKMQHKYLRNAEERHVKVKKMHKSKESIISSAFAGLNNYMFASVKNLRVQSDSTKQMTTAEESSRFTKTESSLLPFLGEVVGPLDLFAVRDWWIKIFRILRTEHLWIRPFSYASSKLTRKIRFLGLANEIMIIAFVDTLFFKLFSPTTADCSLTLREDCLTASSPITEDGRLCQWVEDLTVENGGYCDVNTPPETMMFFVAVSFVVTVVAVPFKLLSYLLLEEVCARSPDFGKVQTYFSKSSYRLSGLGKVMQEAQEAGQEGTAGGAGETARGGETAGGGYLSRIARYYDVASPSEELDYILSAARRFLAKHLMTMPVPWEEVCPAPGGSRAAAGQPPVHVCDDSSHSFATTQLRINEMLRVLNLNDDGSPAPVTWFQRLRYGTHARYLQSKLRSAKHKAESIEAQFGRFNEGEQDFKDVMLMQHFILEALSPLQRFVVRKKFFDFDMQEPESIPGWKWVGGWSLEWLTMLFLFYYVLAWAAIVGNTIFKSWLIQFSFILIEDILITQIIRAILIHGLAVSYCKPQLLQLYHLLKTISVRKILRQDVDHGDIRVVQHFSATCRAARREALQALPAAQLLMTIDDNDMRLCNDVRRLKFTWFQVLLVSVPLIFGFAGEQGQEFVFDMVINVSWGGILIINALIFTLISSWYLFGFYFLLLVFIVCRSVIFYKQRFAKRIAKRQSRGELARFVSMKSKKPKFRLVPRLTMKRTRIKLDISKKELQWRNMNLRLQQTVVQRDASALLSPHAVSVPESIRELSTLTPLLAHHLPPPVEDDTSPRPQSWQRPTSIRSRHRSRRVAQFWEHRREAGRRAQEKSREYSELRGHFLRLSGGRDVLSGTEAVAALASCVHRLKAEGSSGVRSCVEIQELTEALESLTIYSDGQLLLSSFLEWLVEEELLLDKAAVSALSSDMVLSKAAIHNEMEEKQNMSRFRAMRAKHMVNKHRKKGSVDMFAQIIKETSANDQAQRAMANFYAEEEEQQQAIHAEGARAAKLLSEHQSSVMTGRDHQRASGTPSKHKKKQNGDAYSGPGSRREGGEPDSTRGKPALHRRTDAFYKPKRRHAAEEAPARPKRLFSSVLRPKSSSSSGAGLDGRLRRLAGTGRRGAPPPAVKVFAIRNLHSDEV
jgi:hypothetical protein